MVRHSSSFRKEIEYFSTYSVEGEKCSLRIKYQEDSKGSFLDIITEDILLTEEGKIRKKFEGIRFVKIGNKSLVPAGILEKLLIPEVIEELKNDFNLPEEFVEYFDSS